MRGEARLLADGGKSASERQFFRSPEFLRAEGTTHTLVLQAEGGTSAVPLVVREIPGGDEQRDAISPYSYPGARVDGRPVDPGQLDLSDLGLVSAFVRDRLGEPPGLRGGRQRSVALLHDPELPRKSRMSDRQQVRKNEAAGYELERLPGPASPPERRAAFHDVYTQTMQAVGAAERYLFDSGYFELLLGSELSWLFSVLAPDGEVAASALVVESDGLIHYYLSGTADSHRQRAPSKNLIFTVIDWAQERGMPMNLGGGIEPGDGLEAFKRGFANAELPFRTHELVLDPAAYAELSGGRQSAKDFFPAYRAPG